MVSKIFSNKSKVQRLIIAWLIGSGIYFFFAMATGWDGFPYVICQSFMAMGFSAVVVFGSLILGLPLRLLTPYRPQWVAVTFTGFGLLIGLWFVFFPNVFSPLFVWLYPKVQETLTSIGAIPFYLGYFILLFTIVNWPRMKIVGDGTHD